MNSKKFLLFLIGAAFLGALVFASANVTADSNAINFEPPLYHPGSPNGQDGWSSLGSAGLGCAPYDHQIVNNTLFAAGPSFGMQSLRISDAVTSGCFGDQTISKSLVNEAGETAAQSSPFSGGVRQSHFEAQFDIKSTMVAQQSGMLVSISPDRGDGARMSYVRLEDGVAGIDVFFDDYQDAAPFGSLATPALGCGAEDDFIETQIASSLSRSVPHKIKFVLDFVDGARNDVVKVYIDGSLVHTGTSWEDYFRWCTESGGGVVETTPVNDVSRTVDSLLFRTAGDPHITHLGNGYLFDNLSLLSSRPPTSKDDCKNGGWQTHTTANGSPFKNQGQCIDFVEDQKDNDKKDNDDKDRGDKDRGDKDRGHRVGKHDH